MSTRYDIEALKSKEREEKLPEHEDNSPHFSISTEFLGNSLREKYWRAVWIWLEMKQMGSGFCVSPVERLCTITGWKERTVKRWMREGKERGLMSQCPKNKNKWYTHSFDTIDRDLENPEKRVKWYKNTKDFKHWIFAVLVAQIYQPNGWASARIVARRRKGRRADKEDSVHWGGVACQMIEDLCGIPNSTAWRMRQRCHELGYLIVNPRRDEIPLENLTLWDWNRIKRFCDLEDGRVFYRYAYEVIPTVTLCMKWGNRLLQGIRYSRMKGRTSKI